MSDSDGGASLVPGHICRAHINYSLLPLLIHPINS
jgi:hypothetical protein